MIKNEWKSLLKNRILVVVVLAIIIIPVIYAGLFLKSMWDPYGNLDQLPVAVVNHDQPVVYNGKDLNVGKDMEEALSKNDSLDFHFVDSDEAEQGLRDGTYYMVITIPENFSANASTLMDDHPQKMELKYETNPGTNYIASKMSETAVTKIRDEVASQVTETYTQAVFDQIAAAGDGMQDAADGAGELKSGIKTASDGNKTITENLKKLADSTLTFKDGADALTKGLKEYTDGVVQADIGAGQLNDGVKTLTAKVPELTAGINTLNQGVKDYTSGVAELNGNSALLTAGAADLQTGSEAFQKGLDTLKTGTVQYVSGANSLADGVTQYVAGADSLAAGAAQLAPLEELGQVSAGISQLNSSVSGSLKPGTLQITQGLEQLYGQLQSLEGSMTGENITHLSAGLKDAKSGMEHAGEGMNTAASGMLLAADGMTNAASVAEAAGSGISDSASLLENAAAPVSEAVSAASNSVTQCAADANAKLDAARQQIDTANGQINAANQQTAALHTAMAGAQAALQEIQSCADENGMVSAASLNAVIGALSSSSSAAAGVNTVENNVEGIDASAYTSQADQAAAAASQQIAQMQQTLNAAAGQLEQAAAGLKSGAETLSSKSEAMKDGAAQMSDGAEKMAAAAGSIPEISSDPIRQVTSAVGQLYEGAKKADQGVAAVSRALDTLETGTKDLPKAAAGVKTLNEGFQKLTANDPVLTSGAAALKEAGSSVTGGISQVASGGAALSEGVRTLSGGIRTYTDGVNTLAGNNEALTGGTQKLADGAGTLAMGADQLAEGTNTLKAGMEKLVSNNGTLISGADQLAQGAVKIQDGSSQLYDGSKELGSGMDKLLDGSAALEEGLIDGAEEISKASANDDMISMFAAPIVDEETQMTTVENNGHAMAPYMMSVGLWVGCLAFCLMYPLTEYKGKLKSGFSWWAGKASVLYPVAVLQGVLLIFLLHLIDGFTPAEMIKTVLFSCLASVTFTSIMYFFNITFGKVGSFLMLIFMVIQLAGSAGTYPVEISPSFVAKIHAYLPFTYTVNAFRSTIAGGESIRTSVIVLIVLAVVFTALTILQFTYMARAKKNGKRILLDWLEVHGVA